MSLWFRLLSIKRQYFLYHFFRLIIERTILPMRKLSLLITTLLLGLSMNLSSQNLQKATFGAGCFWCVETVFQELKGVQKVTSGYEGGHTKNPTYKEICTGTTGHAEVIQVEFDANVVSYKKLLEVFWSVHDPTTLNRQGNDRGTQYRSVVFYHSEDQKIQAEHYKSELDKSGAFDNPIVTEITASSTFYPAETYHQNYYNDNKSQPYCQFVITPKVEKFRKVFAEDLK